MRKRKIAQSTLEVFLGLSFLSLTGAFAADPPTADGTISDFCQPGKECDDAKKHRRHAQDRLREFRTGSDAETRRYGNGGGRGFASGGAGTGFRGTGGGLARLATAMTGYATQLNQQSRQIAQSQKQIVEKAYSANPTNPDVKRFYDATNGGQSRRADIGDVADPNVKAQASAYDHMGDTRKLLDDEAQKYQDRANHFTDAANRNEQRANGLDNSKNEQLAGNLPNVPPGAAGAGPQSGSPGSVESGGDSTIVASSPGGLTHGKAGQSAEDRARLGTREASSGKPLDVGSLGKFGGGSESGLTAGLAGGGPAAGDSLREALMKKLGQSDPSAPSPHGEQSSQGAGTGSSPEGPLASGEAAGSKGAPGGAEAVSAGGKGTGKNAAGVAAGSEESLQTFSASLGDPKMSLSGSETDASIRNLMGEFGAREPASSSDGVGGREGPSLFERCHATHSRCAQSGCVSGRGKGGKG